MAESIQNLRIYTGARDLEDRIYELTKSLPEEQSYPLGNNLRRTSAAVCHYLSEAHACYSYSLKLDSLAQARSAAEHMQTYLESTEKIVDCGSLRSDYTGIVKQAWGLIRYLKLKRSEKQQRNIISAKDELVAARS